MRQLRITKKLTQRDTPSFDKYLGDIAKYKLVSESEEIELIQKIKNGNKKALNRLIHANLRFVVSVSKQYQNQGMSISDLVNEGNIGLIKAIYKFDETRGFKFISYAVWWIRQSIIQALGEQSRIVKLPSDKIATIKKVSKASSELEQKLGRKATSEELADILGMKKKDINQAILGVRKHVSMDAPLIENDDSSSSLIDLLKIDNQYSPDKKLLKSSLAKEINRSLNKLSKIEGDVLRFYYGLNSQRSKSINEIADYFDLTKERIRQIRNQAIKNLKNGVGSNLLKEYLG